MIDPQDRRSPGGSCGYRASGIALALPLLLWGILLAALPLRMQGFSLGDDWGYAIGVFRLARGEGLHYLNWSATTLLGQWLVALPTVWLVGESLAALRMVTVLLSLAGGVAFCDLLRRDLQLSDLRAGFLAAALLVGPLYFILSGTFMTDVSTLSFCLIALALWGRGLDSQRLGWIAGGSAAAILAVINRQNAITAPAAMGLMLLSRGVWRQPRWILGVGLPVLVWVAIVVWFRQRADVVKFNPELSLDRILAFPLVATLQTGLVLLPLWALTAGIGRSRKLLLSIGAIGLLAAVWIAYRRLLLGQSLSENVPNIGPYLTPWGAFGVPELIGSGRPPLIVDLWLLALVVGVPAAISGAALWSAVAQNVRSAWLLHSLPLFGLLNIPFILIANTGSDRYLVFLAPSAIFLAAGATRQRPAHWLRGAIVLGLFAAISLGLLHDWLAWNAARWELGRRGLARGIPVKQLHGGWEWNCYHQQHVRPLDPPESVAAYALVDSPPSNTAILDHEPYWVWLAAEKRQIYLVERKKEAASNPPSAAASHKPTPNLPATGQPSAAQNHRPGGN